MSGNFYIIFDTSLTHFSLYIRTFKGLVVIFEVTPSLRFISTEVEPIYILTAVPMRFGIN